MNDGQTHQALSLLQQAFDALEATTDSDIDDFEDEIEEAEAVPAQYACRKIMEAIGLLKDGGNRIGDLLQVLRMVDDNNRVDAGEDRKAWPVA
jgi:hypothetical protein